MSSFWLDKGRKLEKEYILDDNRELDKEYISSDENYINN